MECKVMVVERTYFRFSLCKISSRLGNTGCEVCVWEKECAASMGVRWLGRAECASGRRVRV